MEIRRYKTESSRLEFVGQLKSGDGSILRGYVEPSTSRLFILAEPGRTVGKSIFKLLPDKLEKGQNPYEALKAESLENHANKAIAEAMRTA